MHTIYPSGDRSARMVTSGQLYAAVVVGLLFAALGISIPVLRGIYRDGLERRRERRLQERERDTDVGTSTPAAAFAESTADGAAERRPCPQCGVENDPSFTYCRRCTAVLRSTA